MAFPQRGTGGASPLLLAASKLAPRPNTGMAGDTADPVAPLHAAIDAVTSAEAAEQDPGDKALIGQALQLLHQVAQNNQTEAAPGPGGGGSPFGP